MGEFRTLVAWQKAMDLVDEIYRAVQTFPRSELFSLSQQLRAAAASVPSLIAEGKGRFTIRDQQHFYREARGSNYELQTQIEIAIRQGFIDPEKGAVLLRHAERVGRLINGLLNSLKRKALSPSAKT